MQITIKFRLQPAAAERERLPFDYYSGRPPRAWRGFLISAAVHAVAAPLLLAVSGLSSGHLIPRSSIARYDVEPISVLIPPRLYYAAEREPGKDDSTREAPRRTGLMANAESRARIGEAGGLRLPARLELPEAQSRRDIPETILQPQPHMMPAPLGMRAARVVAWPQMTIEARKSVVRIPGPSGARAKMREVDAPPRLEAPNPEASVANVNIGSRPTEVRPALPVPPSSTTPVRVSGAAATTEPAGSEAPGADASDAVNLMILSSVQSRSPEIVTVPPGSNIQAPVGDGGAGARFEFGRGPEIAGLAGNRESEAPRDIGRSRTTVGGGGGGAVNERAVSERTGQSGHAAGVAAAQGAAAQRASAGGAPPRRAAAAQPPKPPKESQHPIHQAYDVMIIQPSGGSSYNEDWGGLSGKPIYTVYLEVGAVKAWALHYCLPKPPQKQEAQQTVVYLDQLETVEAPYPLSTEMPREAMERRSRYTLIHGVLTASGRFRDLRVVSPDGRPEAILEYLARWVFRPALKDRTPVDVEALLAVPPSL